MKQDKSKKKQPIIYSLYKYMIILIIILLLFNYLYSDTSLLYQKRIILPFSFQLNKTKLYMTVGEEHRLFTFGKKDRIEFASTNFNVADVNFIGIVKAYRPGKTYIIAKSGDRQARCLVRVIDINKKKLTLKAGKSYRLKLRGIFSFASFKSSNENVASVSIFGRVKAKRRGNAIIYTKVKGKVLRTEITVK